MEKVDQTIDAICEWINDEIKTQSCQTSSHEIAEMVKSLAELVSARWR